MVYYLIQLEQKAYLTITHKTESFFHIDSIELTEYTNILCMQYQWHQCNFHRVLNFPRNAVWGSVPSPIKHPCLICPHTKEFAMSMGRRRAVHQTQEVNLVPKYQANQKIIHSSEINRVLQQILKFFVGTLHCEQTHLIHEECTYTTKLVIRTGRCKEELQ